jgi:metal-responsive CopG/Arc/MetJ family transcriptional regulator
MGRPKQFTERILLAMPEGTTARIDALLQDGEYRLDFIRDAIETEIERRCTRRGNNTTDRSTADET